MVTPIRRCQTASPAAGRRGCCRRPLVAGPRFCPGPAPRPGRDSDRSG